MDFIGVSDLKKSKELWEKLGREKELVLTRDGRPGALILAITPDGLEATLAAVRRALFSEAVAAARRRATAAPAVGFEEVDRDIRASRQRRAS